MVSPTTCVAAPTKKKKKLPYLRSNRQLEPPLPLNFSGFFTVIRPRTVRFFLNRKSYGPVRCGFKKAELSRCGSVRFSDIVNPTVRFQLSIWMHLFYFLWALQHRWDTFRVGLCHGIPFPLYCGGGVIPPRKRNNRLLAQSTSQGRAFWAIQQ